MKELTPFSFLADVVQDKEYLYSDETAKSFVPFLVLRGLSLRQQTLPYADIANGLAHLPLQMQHDFLFFEIPKQSNRFVKWPKRKADDDLVKAAQMLWELTPEKARIAVSLLSDSERDELREINDSINSG